MAGAPDARHQGAAKTLWPDFHGTDGRALPAHSEGVRPLRSSCLAVQRQSERHVQPDEPEGEMQQGRVSDAGKTDQDDARPDVTTSRGRSLRSVQAGRLAFESGPQGPFSVCRAL